MVVAVAVVAVAGSKYSYDVVCDTSCYLYSCCFFSSNFLFFLADIILCNVTYNFFFLFFL